MSSEHEQSADQGDHAFTAGDLHAKALEPAYSGALSFARRLYTKNYRDDAVDVVVSGVPFDLATSNRPGTRFGPRAIRAATSQLSWGAPHWPWTFDPFDHLGVIDWGDLAFEYGNAQDLVEKLEAHAADVLRAGKSMLSLGGDHMIALPLLRAHGKHLGQLSLIHFDAHTDTYDDESTYDHGTMFRLAVEENLIDPDRSVQIGIRTDYTREGHRFRVLDADWVQNNPLQATIDAIRETVGDNPAYLSFDIDCLDPCYAPGTGTPVCGGLTTNQAMQILRSLVSTNLVGMDLVEVAPAYDVGEITALAAAHLAFDYLCVRAAQKRGV